MESYDELMQIGDGSYGTVFRAINKKTKELVAIKKIKIGKESGFSVATIREIKTIKTLKSQHCVDAVDIIFDGNTLFLVLEYMPYDLYGLIHNNAELSNDQFRCILYQILFGVAHIHKLGFIHRDIKSSNVLIDNNGKVKLADFGLTCRIKDNMTNPVCTLWYRAPELLLGDDCYDFAVDSWSIGIIMLEMKMKRVPFYGSDEIQQIKQIFKTLGTPKEKYIWSSVYEQSKYERNECFDNIIYKNYGKYFERDELDLLKHLLYLSPAKRILPCEAIDNNMLRWDSKLVEFKYDDVHEFYCAKKPSEMVKKTF